MTVIKKCPGGVALKGFGRCNVIGSCKRFLCLRLQGISDVLVLEPSCV